MPPDLSARAAQALGGLSLAGLVAGTTVVVVIVAERPSFLTPTTRPGRFPGWMVGPLRGLWPGLTRNGDTLAWLVSALIGAMYALCLAAVWSAPRLRARWTVATVLAIHAVLLLAPPLFYRRIQRINHWRMGVVHHLNPYGVVPALEPHSDPSFALSNWHHLLTPYGPLFTLLTYALVPLGVHLSFWVLKLLVGAASLATLALVWKCPGPRSLAGGRGRARRSQPDRPDLGGRADHNDALIMLFVVLAL